MAYNRLNEDALTALQPGDRVVVLNRSNSKIAEVVRTTQTQIVVKAEGVYAERRFNRKSGYEIGNRDSYYGRSGLYVDDADARDSMARESAVTGLSLALGHLSDNTRSLRMASRNGRLSTPELIELRNLADALSKRVEEITNPNYRSEN